MIWKCTQSPKQLQKKFDKHAGDFGITGNNNLINRELFKKAILNHLVHKDTIVIEGTYRNMPVKHYYNRVSKINAICKDNEFLSGWRLSAEQERYIITTGNLK